MKTHLRDRVHRGKLKRRPPVLGEKLEHVLLKVVWDEDTKRAVFFHDTPPDAAINGIGDPLKVGVPARGTAKGVGGSGREGELRVTRFRVQNQLAEASLMHSLVPGAPKVNAAGTCIVSAASTC